MIQHNQKGEDGIMEQTLHAGQRDREFYAAHLRDFLPERLIDIHTHVWLRAFETKDPGGAVRGARWPARVAAENPIEALVNTYETLFPGKQVTPLIFGYPGVTYDVDRQNEYVARKAKQYGLPALALTRPQWSPAEFESLIRANGFLGCKVYFNYAESYIPEKEIRIYDFLPRHQLEVLDRNRWIAMLHIPREGRLRDPVNLAQMLEIEETYPHVRLIIAHVGRAYCPEDMGDAMKILSGTSNMLFDISANTNETVFHELIKAFGPQGFSLAAISRS